ncbi:putative transposable element [Trichonephila clavipes]|nr:putative transposable element [Trichonephila clavipes]
MNRLMPEQRFQIVQFYFENNGSVRNFHKRILFSEAHFWLNGYVNKQNCRIWSEANPQVYVETPLYPEKLTVWCALWAGGIIGPYFFKNDEGHNVTVNGDRYRTMITNFFIPEMNNHDVQELWFQQDGATCHIARATIDLLKDTFGDRLISRFGPVNWPPRPCDLTPLDYFLWGYVKSLVYADKPQTLDHLEDNIRRVIADIRPQMLEKVIENWMSRLDYIRASRGSHMPAVQKTQVDLKKYVDILRLNIDLSHPNNLHKFLLERSELSGCPLCIQFALCDVLNLASELAASFFVSTAMGGVLLDSDSNSDSKESDAIESESEIDISAEWNDTVRGTPPQLKSFTGIPPDAYLLQYTFRLLK